MEVLPYHVSFIALRAPSYMACLDNIGDMRLLAAQSVMC